jgi:diguanylate cyclase (GGDEF)-like protein
MIKSIALDTPTLLIVSAMIITLTGILFIVDSLSRSQDVVGRIWSIAFLAGVITTFCYLIADQFSAVWWGVGMGNGTVVLSLGAVWAGARRFNGRRSLLWVVATASAIACVAALVFGPHGGPWAGGIVMLVGVAAFGILGGVECFRGRLAAYRNARFLGAICFIAGFYYFVRAVFFLSAGPHSSFFMTFLGTGITTLVVIVFVTGGAFSMVALRGEESRHAIEGGDDSGGSAQAAVAAEFADVVRPVLSRLSAEGRGASLVIADIDGFSELNSAFGRRYGDFVLVRFVEELRASVPESAPIGRLDGNRFALFLAGMDRPQAVALAQRIRERLVETPLIDDAMSLRVTASFGVAALTDGGGGYSALLAEAERAMLKAKRQGRNRVATPERDEEGLGV